MADLSPEQVGTALKRLGHYRCMRAQQVAGEGGPDGVSGSLLLSLGLRETGLRNIEGGAVFRDGKWVPAKNDTGWTQINRFYHGGELHRMPAVRAGTWAPVVEGHTPAEEGFCPRFEEALQFTLTEIHEAIAFAGDNGVTDRVRFAIAAHNAGEGGALKGHKAGDVDRYTAGGDYSAWCIRHRSLVNKWLAQHEGWKA